MNEAYFIRCARAARFPVVEATVVHDATGNAVSLAVEDAAQVLGLYPADKYLVSAETAANALADLCAARVVAARELFRQLCFAWVTGNGDVHAKNLSVLAGPTGEWRVSPAYDLPSTLPYGDSTMALTIGGRSDGLSRRILLALAADLGIPEVGQMIGFGALPTAETPTAHVGAEPAPPPEHRIVTLPGPSAPAVTAQWRRAAQWLCSLGGLA